MKKVADNICEIVAVRHGETASNHDGIIQGQLNIPLNELGLLQAQAAATRLSKWQFDAVFASDLDRAMITAETILSFHPGLTVTPTAALREWDLGFMQGRRIADLNEKHPEIMAAFRRDLDDLNIPEGESLAEFQNRVSGFITGLAQQYQGKRILLVTHGGAMQRMLKHATGAISGNNVRPFCANASLAVFRCKDAINWQLVTWNDTAHLEGLEQKELLPL
ncbi:MAG: histidine phosphatase family protein [Lentisphaerae bacterium]|nr:histidine phosphatase family protein [Lentisphaerota bacterium]